jgi:hypothetical protein
MTEKIIMYDSPEAATFKTDISGWVASDGRFYGKDENIARYAGCTHRTCPCGKIYSKGHVRCDSCQSKLDSDKYYALPVEDWDGSEPVCVYNDDTYFFDEDSLLDWMADLKADLGENEEAEVQIVKCARGKLHTIDYDNWCDDLPEDGELPDEVCTKIEELNEAIRNAPTVCWYPGKIRINLKTFWDQVEQE